MLSVHFRRLTTNLPYPGMFLQEEEEEDMLMEPFGGLLLIWRGRNKTTIIKKSRYLSILVIASLLQKKNHAEAKQSNGKRNASGHREHNQQGRFTHGGVWASNVTRSRSATDGAEKEEDLKPIQASRVTCYIHFVCG